MGTEDMAGPPGETARSKGKGSAPSKIQSLVYLMFCLQRNMSDLVPGSWRKVRSQLGENQGEGRCLSFLLSPRGLTLGPGCRLGNRPEAHPAQSLPRAQPPQPRTTPLPG